MIELFRRAEAYGDRLAVVSGDGSVTYAELFVLARAVAARLLETSLSLNGARVAMMVPPGSTYVAVQWGVWLAGGIAVPLALTNPDAELAYVIDDAGATRLIGAGSYLENLRRVAAGSARSVTDAAELIESAPADAAATLPAEVDEAMLLYTSGTTGRAKGVVWRHSALEAQVEIMSQAWGWRSDDRALLVLPLHHVHGLINVLAASLWNGATVEMPGGFDAAATWGRLGSGEVSVFMAVPTIYRRLLTAWNAIPAGDRARWAEALRGMRLMVSGSAALPVATLEAWRSLSGHTLLERYGMTEIGMALSNSYDGDRIPGAVGRPLPTVEARVVDDRDMPVTPGTPGTLQVRGPSVFERYWQRPEATSDSFVDGWFRTGDAVVVEDGTYRILGRESVDIIKTGGEKVSALEIEEVLRRHAHVADCAVVGVDDSEWGERVVVAATVDGVAPSLDELRDFCRDQLAPAKIPRGLVVVDELPRNALGKVLKPQVKELFDTNPGSAESAPPS